MSVVSSPPMLSPPLPPYEWKQLPPTMHAPVPDTPIRDKSFGCTPKLFSPVEQLQKQEEDSIDDELFSFLDEICSLHSTVAEQPLPGSQEWSLSSARKGTTQPMTVESHSEVLADSGLSLDHASQTNVNDSTRNQHHGGTAPGPSFVPSGFNYGFGTAPTAASQPSSSGRTTPRHESIGYGGAAPIQSISEDSQLPQIYVMEDSMLGTSTRVKKLKSIDEVLENNRDLCNPGCIVKLTVKLANEAVFGHEVLVKSSVTGKVGEALDSHMLETLQAVLRTKNLPRNVE